MGLALVALGVAKALPSRTTSDRVSIAAAGPATAAIPPPLPPPSTTTTVYVPKAPALEVVTDYYEVAGRTAYELNEAMARHGLRDSFDHALGDAQTSWSLSWHYEYPQTPTLTRVIVVTGKATITMPHWTPPPGVDGRLVARWSRYMAALTRHEGEHAATMQRCAAALPEAIAATRTADEANAAVAAKVEQCHQEDVALDARTRHGATEGAVF